MSDVKRFQKIIWRHRKMPSPLKSIYSVWLLTLASTAGWAASVATDEKPAMPADLYYEFKAIPADENAIISWRRAAAIEVPLRSEQVKTIRYCSIPAAREPSGDELDGLQECLKRNNEALDIFGASLQKTMAQWPERNLQNKQPELAAFSIMMRLRLFKADQLAEQKKYAVAAKSLEDSLKLAQKGVDGDAALIQYSIACNMRTITQDAMLRLASRRETPVSIIEELLTNLPSLTLETNVYNHVLRVDFTRDYNNSIDMKKLASGWSKMSATNPSMLSLFPDELQRTFRILIDPSLMPFHPKPFDVNDDIEKSAEHYRIYRTNSLSPWTERSGEVELEMEDDRKNLAKDVAPLMEVLKDDPLPLSREAAQRARTAYLQIDNPVGRIMSTSILGFMISDLKVFQVRTEREATRTFLALIIFEKRKGQLPAKLSDLVDEKILDSVPLDPFCDEPLHYSKEKRKIWSVSDNGVDDNGESGKIRWYEKDAVWQIPQLN